MVGLLGTPGRNRADVPRPAAVPARGGAEGSAAVCGSRDPGPRSATRRPRPPSPRRRCPPPSRDHSWASNVGCGFLPARPQVTPANVFAPAAELRRARAVQQFGPGIRVDGRSPQAA